MVWAKLGYSREDAKVILFQYNNIFDVLKGIFIIFLIFPVKVDVFIL